MGDAREVSDGAIGRRSGCPNSVGEEPVSITGSDSWLWQAMPWSLAIGSLGGSVFLVYKLFVNHEPETGLRAWFVSFDDAFRILLFVLLPMAIFLLGFFLGTRQIVAKVNRDYAKRLEELVKS